MKKILLIVTSVLIAATALTGCGKKVQNNAADNFTASTYQPVESTYKPVNTPSATPNTVSESTPQPIKTEKPAKTQNTEAPKSELKSFESELGYSVKYPSSYSPTSISDAVDFVIADSNSGSNINIYTMYNVDDIDGISKEDFEASMAAQGMDVSITSFTHTTINGLKAIKTTYKFLGNDVMQVMYVNGNFIHYVTYTKMSNTSSAVDSDLEKVAMSLKAN